MNRRVLALSVALGVSIAALPVSGVAAPASQAHAPAAGRGAGTADRTMEVQYVLRSYGYTIAVDGIYGPQTTKVVTLWQKANGLAPDGIAGPLTQASLGLGDPATASAPAVRVDPPASGPTPQSAVEPDDPIETGFGIEPGNCETFRPLMEKYGLPADKFLAIARRESNCLPNVHNGRGRDDSYGLGQINTYGNLWGELQWRCGLEYKEQLYDPETNIRCMAELYKAYGMKPWSTS